MGKNADAPSYAPQTDADYGDSYLLRRYVRDGSQTAFATLVRRYGGLVHAACLREVDDKQLAEDVTQVVFLLLARRAPSLLHAASLAGWLFRAARFSARNALRRERRRNIHEQEVIADMTQAHFNGPPIPTRSLLEPLVNAALASLRPHEQEVVLLRYLEGASWRETAARLGLAEDAAQKRATRAVDKMRRFVHRHGLTLSLAALTALLSEEAAQAVALPPAMILKIVAVPSPHITSLYGGLIHTMKMTKIAVALGSLAVAGTVGGILWARPAHTPLRPARLQAASPPHDAETPQDMLTQVRDHYGSLSSFSMQITHQDSSGLYPGRYTQHLQWRRGTQVEGSRGHFVLRNMSPSNKTLREDLVTTNDGTQNAPRTVPDFLADGRHVRSLWPGGKQTTDWEAPQPNSVPGWEVTGGSILSWLQDTPTGRFYLTPPPGVTLQWSIGPRTLWRGQKVQELLAQVTNQGQTDTSSYFLSATSPTLVGFEWRTGKSGGGKIGYALYTNQKENPPLPTTLGNAP